MIQSIIVDDELLARRRIRDRLAHHEDVTVVAECRDGWEAIDAIQRLRPELVFLDIQMPELDGFGVIARIDPSVVPVVVFVSAYDEYALRAFEAHALDYLLKPFDDTRFDATLERARVDIDKGRALALRDRVRTLKDGMRAQGSDRIAIRSTGRTSFVATRDIQWIQAAGVYVEIQTGDARHLARMTLATLEHTLDPERFVRIHRSTIVAVDAVAELRPEGHGDVAVVLRDGTVLRMSRRFRARSGPRLGLA